MRHLSHAIALVVTCALLGMTACSSDAGGGGGLPAGNAGHDAEHQAVAPTALPAGADAATGCTDAAGDTAPAAGAGVPDLTDVSMVSSGDTVVLAFTFIAPVPTSGDLVMAVEATSDDGKTVRQLGVKLHDGQSAGAFVSDSSGGAPEELGDVVHVGDAAVHAGFPITTITDLGPTWHWDAVVGSGDGIADLCPGGKGTTLGTIGSISVG